MGRERERDRELEWDGERDRAAPGGGLPAHIRETKRGGGPNGGGRWGCYPQYGIIIVNKE